VDWRSLTHVVVSHFHTDHIGDLAPFLFGLTYGLPEVPRTAPLTLVGPPGFGRVLEGLATAHGEWVTGPPFPLEVVEVGRNDRVERAGFALVCHPVTHTPEAVAWRVETSNGVVAYTGDTGPDPAVGPFLAGADLLVCECAVPDGSEVPIHLTPSQVAEVAGAARPGLLVLTHCYPPLDPDRTPHLVRAAGYEGAVTAARDGATYLVRAGRVEPPPTGGV
jgi:ribonuclease BN (tRNA processing enzyme)